MVPGRSTKWGGQKNGWAKKWERVGVDVRGKMAGSKAMLTAGVGRRGTVTGKKISGKKMLVLKCVRRSLAAVGIFLPPPFSCQHSVKHHPVRRRSSCPFGTRGSRATMVPGRSRKWEGKKMSGQKNGSEGADVRSKLAGSRAFLKAESCPWIHAAVPPFVCPEWLSLTMTWGQQNRSQVNAAPHLPVLNVLVLDFRPESARWQRAGL